mmetsp:Transcript_92127/g.260274  ORF Transcript_92127/g.260274 Transcript_92127/m.260274 type:complete len:207 (+) Transcript_92127:897-1517(+)
MSSTAKWASAANRSNAACAERWPVFFEISSFSCTSSSACGTLPAKSFAATMPRMALMSISGPSRDAKMAAAASAAAIASWSLPSASSALETRPRAMASDALSPSSRYCSRAAIAAWSATSLGGPKEGPWEFASRCHALATPNLSPTAIASALADSAAFRASGLFSRIMCALASLSAAVASRLASPRPRKRSLASFAVVRASIAHSW